MFLRGNLPGFVNVSRSLNVMLVHMVLIKLPPVVVGKIVSTHGFNMAAPSTPPKKKIRLHKPQKFLSSYTEKWPCLVASKLDEFHAFCTVCNTNVDISHQGSTGKSLLFFDVVGKLLG